jgi:integrase
MARLRLLNCSIPYRHLYRPTQRFRETRFQRLLKMSLETCGLMTTIPHVPAVRMIRTTAHLGFQAMSKSTSATKVPHVGNGERDYLRPEEVNAVIAAAGKLGRNGVRDQVLLRLMYRHGLRASEARHVRWTDFDLDGSRTFHVRRLKGSADSMHTLDRDELSALRKMRDVSDSPFVFISERGGPISPDMIARIVERAAEVAGIGFHVHPHMLRHSAGYMLANLGTDTRLIQAHLGHKNIQHTVRYTALSPQRLASVRVR